MSERRRFQPGLHRPETARDDMRAELEFHISERAARLEARGMTPEAARAEAIRLLGSALDDAGVTLGASAERKERKLRMREWLEDLVGDIRYAIKGLLNRPAFTAVAVATLAIAIGGNTAIYSAIDALILKPLPFRQPDQLMDIVLTSPETGPDYWSYPKAKVFEGAQKSFSSLALYSAFPATLTGDQPERIRFETVSAAYLGTLGIPLALGHDFDRGLDAGPGVGKFAIISDALWRRRFGATQDVVGRRVALDNESYEIVGVLPPDFRGVSGNADLLVNVTSRDAESLAQAWSLEFQMVGRLKPGVTPEQASDETRRIGTEVYRQFPTPAGTLTTAKTFEWGADARPLDGIRVAAVLRRSLYVLFAAVGMVLLIACVNLASLLLGRAVARRREIAVRLAIGATRARLVRLVLTESMVLSLAGGLAGTGLAWWACSALAALNPADALQAQALAGGIGAIGFSNITLNGSALLFTLGVTVVVGLLFGLAPALGATRVDLTDGLKDDGALAAPTRHGRRLDRRALVVAEVALAVMLLAGSGLTVRSLVKLLGVDPGFRADRVITLRLMVPPGSVSRDSMPGVYDAMQQRLAAIPGVSEVALADCPPIAGGCNGTVMTFPDRPSTSTGNAMVGVHWVSPDWFKTMGVPLKRGRLFETGDRVGAPKVVLINEAAARKYFPNEDPLGKQVKVYQGGFHTGATVVGIVGDVRFGTIDQPAAPDAYISYAQSSPGRAMVFLKTALPAASIVPAARAAVREAAPFSPVFDVRPMAERMASATSQARLSAGLLGAFAAIGLALAVMGIYGVMAFAVTQRTREIGIRVALGADRGRVVRLFTREGLVLCAWGVALGLAGALAGARVLRTLLFEIGPDDPATFVGIVIVVAVAALVSTWVPARKAAGLDPVRALK